MCNEDCNKGKKYLGNMSALCEYWRSRVTIERKNEKSYDKRKT